MKCPRCNLGMRLVVFAKRITLPNGKALPSETYRCPCCLMDSRPEDIEQIEREQIKLTHQWILTMLDVNRDPVSSPQKSFVPVPVPVVVAMPSKNKAPAEQLKLF